MLFFFETMLFVLTHLWRILKDLVFVFIVLALAVLAHYMLR